MVRRCCIFLFFPTVFSIIINVYRHEPPLHGELPDHLEEENKATNSVRTSIEWAYGDIIVLFRVLESKYQKKYYMPDQTTGRLFYI